MDLNTIKEYIELKYFSDIKKELPEMKPADIAELLNELDIKKALLVFRLLPKSFASDVFSNLDKELQSNFSSLINDKELMDIINELYFDDKIDFLEEVPANVVKKILRYATARERSLINQFLNYPEYSAGSLMTIEFVDLKKEMTVENAMKRIRKIALDKETIYTCYVTNNTRKLEGIVSLKDLVLKSPENTIESFMQTDVVAVNTHDDQEEIIEVFKKYDFLSLPVVDKEERLVGIITVDDVMDAIEQEHTEDFQKMAGIEPAEIDYIDSSVYDLSKRRVPWLIILMFSAMTTEWILNYNQSLNMKLQLSAYIPMLMSTGGNAGAQSATLVIRSITLGNIQFKDILKILFKELKVGLLVGSMLGFLNFTRIFMMYGRQIAIGHAFVVGLTLICTITFAAIMGGTLPIVAKKLKFDPAIMASPIVTTIVDASTLVIYFNIAKLFKFMILGI